MEGRSSFREFDWNRRIPARAWPSGDTRYGRARRTSVIIHMQGEARCVEALDELANGAKILKRI